MSRKKDKVSRVRLTSYVLPKTEEAIRAKVRRGDRKANTPGKVIDSQFDQQQP